MHESDDDDLYDKNGYPKADRWKTFRHDYRINTCLLCRSEIRAPVSRMRWVMRMHVERCESSTPEERTVFRRTRHWPKRKKMGVL